MSEQNRTVTEEKHCFSFKQKWLGLNFKLHLECLTHWHLRFNNSITDTNTNIGESCIEKDVVRSAVEQ